MIATKPGGIPRTIFEPEHELLRESMRAFCEREIAPYHAAWEVEGAVPRALWRRAGELGFLCMSLPAEYGGADADFRASVVFMEELARINATGPGFVLQTDIVAPYLLRYGTQEQKRRWLPPLASGEIVSAIAMTEPGTGSDLAAVATRADRTADGYVLNGAKTFNQRRARRPRDRRRQDGPECGQSRRDALSRRTRHAGIFARQGVA